MLARYVGADADDVREAALEELCNLSVEIEGDDEWKRLRERRVWYGYWRAQRSRRQAKLHTPTTLPLAFWRNHRSRLESS